MGEFHGVDNSAALASHPGDPPDDQEPRCWVCGGWVGAGRRDDDCQCPECPVCAEIGDPACYGEDHMQAEGTGTLHAQGHCQHGCGRAMVGDSSDFQHASRCDSRSEK